MTWVVFLTKNLAPGGAARALTPQALLGPASAGALATPLRNLSERLGFLLLPILSRALYQSAKNDELSWMALL